MSDYPKTLNVGLYGMSKSQIKEFYSEVWNDQQLFMLGIIINNYDTIANIKELCTSGLIFQNVKKVISCFWANDILDLEKANVLYNMLTAEDDKDFNVALEIIKNLLPENVKLCKFNIPHEA